MMTTRRAMTAALAATTLLAGACRSGPLAAPPAGPPAAPTVPITAPASSPPPVTAPGGAPAAAAPGGTGPIVAAGAGWTGAGLDGPIPGAGTCHYRRAADGYDLPDPSCTPGAVDPAVTAANLSSTICRAGGYTSTVRPPERLTGAFKPLDRAAYQDPDPSSSTELDHLVPLELGGASDTRNLWPQPDQGSPAQFEPGDHFGANAKDGVEDRLHRAVCAGQVGLVAAQQAIAADWTTALVKALGVTP